MNMANDQSLLNRWGITESQLTELVDNNPSLRGMMLGYVAELKFHEQFLDHPRISEATKDDDHDRSRKGDRRILYDGVPLVIEVKSLQTATVKRLGTDKWHGKSQVDGSDRRMIQFTDGSELNTTLLRRGDFDLLAVNCFAFGDKWRFVFAKNSDLPTSSFRRYTEAQQKQLIASLIPVSWPPAPPFSEDPFPLLDNLVLEKRNSPTHR